jgi:hypothetical protein
MKRGRRPINELSEDELLKWALEEPNLRYFLIPEIFWRRFPNLLSEIYEGCNPSQRRGRPKKNGELSETDAWGLSHMQLTMCTSGETKARTLARTAVDEGVEKGFFETKNGRLCVTKASHVERFAAIWRKFVEMEDGRQWVAHALSSWGNREKEYIKK